MMTKSQVVAHLAKKSGMEKKAAAAVLEELVSLATKECRSGGQFVIPGLGKTAKANRRARMAGNSGAGAPRRPRRLNPAPADADEVFATLAKAFSRL